MNKLAQINLGPTNRTGRFGCEGNSMLCGGLNPDQAPNTLNTLITTIIGVMTAIAFIWFTIQFLLGAIGIMTAGGDKAKAAEARAKLTSGVVGIVIVIAAIFIISLIGQILGIENILSPGSFIFSYQSR